MKTIKSFFTSDNKKGISMVEISIVLALAGILLLGFMGSWGDKDRLDEGWRIESIAVARYIIAREKVYAAANLDNYIEVPQRTGIFVHPENKFTIDIRNRQYFSEFSLTISSARIPDAFGVERDLPLMYITLYGAGLAAGVERKAEYNRFADILDWKDDIYNNVSS